ncbi:5-carboxymethyl-2-hydroxymuconate Delta-isomerase [Silvimonas sp.]|uniref:5-carboxymethyl-2-hydroxymuconate Delta-isomerase n=1 Tax=Silvimonas sp. TaxID=2650811 RepID=UPI00283EDDC1|nr:5-carboxymethyl-2-hydroxymuconate Delta-isomerase [Silvimonas sp.]MDR3426808.1 5-carboxymethyl-2-hydroxymuconate Delta-isomerase [Silvimonas sp.]
MPNLTLQYTANLTDQFVPTELLSRLHGAFAATGQFAMNDVKGRVIRLDQFQVGLNEAPDKSFVHVIVATMTTRSEALKKELGQALLEELKKTFRDKFDAEACQLRVEIVPIDPAFYFAG